MYTGTLGLTILPVTLLYMSNRASHIIHVMMYAHIKYPCNKFILKTQVNQNKLVIVREIFCHVYLP